MALSVTWQRALVLVAAVLLLAFACYDKCATPPPVRPRPSRLHAGDCFPPIETYLAAVLSGQQAGARLPDNNQLAEIRSTIARYNAAYRERADEWQTVVTRIVAERVARGNKNAIANVGEASFPDGAIALRLIEEEGKLYTVTIYPGEDVELDQVTALLRQVEREGRRTISQFFSSQAFSP